MNRMVARGADHPHRGRPYDSYHFLPQHIPYDLRIAAYKLFRAHGFLAFELQAIYVQVAGAGDDGEELVSCFFAQGDCAGGYIFSGFQGFGVSGNDF